MYIYIRLFGSQFQCCDCMHTLDGFLFWLTRLSWPLLIQHDGRVGTFYPCHANYLSWNIVKAHDRLTFLCWNDITIFIIMIIEFTFIMHVICLLYSILPQANKWPLLYPVSYTLGGTFCIPLPWQPLPNTLQTIIDLWHNDPWLGKQSQSAMHR